MAPLVLASSCGRYPRDVGPNRYRVGTTWPSPVQPVHLSGNNDRIVLTELAAGDTDATQTLGTHPLVGYRGGAVHLSVEWFVRPNNTSAGQMTTEGSRPRNC